jgi:hypothetical protein
MTCKNNNNNNKRINGLLITTDSTSSQPLLSQGINFLFHISDRGGAFFRWTRLRYSDQRVCFLIQHSTLALCLCKERIFLVHSHRIRQLPKVNTPGLEQNHSLLAAHRTLIFTENKRFMVLPTYFVSS